MWLRGCAAAILTLFLVGAKPVDTARAELDHLKAAGASDEKLEQATKAYHSYVTTSAPSEEAYQHFNTAMIGLRDDVVSKRVAFIRAARQRLEPRGVSVTDQNIAAWSQGQQTESILDDTQWTASTARIYDAAASVNEKSHVTFRTDASGATVRYQTLKDAKNKKEALTADGSTNCEQDLTPAAYYIWTERHGKATSKRREWDIIEPTRTITLPEDQ